MNINNFENVEENYNKFRTFHDSDSNTTVVFENSNNNSWETEHFNRSLNTRLYITDNVTSNPEFKKFYGNNNYFHGESNPNKNIIHSLNNILEEANLKISQLENTLSHLYSKVNLIKPDFTKRNEIQNINKDIKKIQVEVQQQKIQQQQVIEQIMIQQNINTPAPNNYQVEQQQTYEPQQEQIINVTPTLSEVAISLDTTITSVTILLALIFAKCAIMLCNSQMR